MRKYLFIFVLILFITGCENSNPKISEDDAKLTALEEHSKDIKIISISHEDGQYIVKWEIDPHFEFGAYYIDDQSGEIVEGEESRC
ncbi:hypothetical protein [Ornithinibacillus scapharcae]|uniref:hypothetical protein n=1 Tax=Ornithinibacillus scapharcae TaxID=1147159 RepID=UPI000225BC45|nr:hypothetical protein [Ornithinibacillus scapharcae]